MSSPFLEPVVNCQKSIPTLRKCKKELSLAFWPIRIQERTIHLCTYQPVVFYRWSGCCQSSYYEVWDPGSLRQTSCMQYRPCRAVISISPFLPSDTVPGRRLPQAPSPQPRLPGTPGHPVRRVCPGQAPALPAEQPALPHGGGPGRLRAAAVHP